MLGGVLVDGLGWRSIFLLNLPLVVVAIGLALRFMPLTRATAAPPLDLAGLILLTIGLAAIVAGLLHMQAWPTVIDAGVLLFGAIVLGAFVVVEQRSPHPLLPLALLREPHLAGSVAALISIQASVLGITVYLLLFLENGLGLAATAPAAY